MKYLYDISRSNVSNRPQRIFAKDEINFQNQDITVFRSKYRFVVESTEVGVSSWLALAENNKKTYSPQYVF